MSRITVGQNMPMIPALANERRRKELAWALLFIGPNLVGFLVFVAFPVVFSLVMAFTNWDLLQREPLRFAGLENFRTMLFGAEAKRFWKFFTNTLYLMLGIPAGIAGSLFLAVLLHEPLRYGRRWVRGSLLAICLLAGAGGAALCFGSGRTTAGLALAILTGCSLIGLTVDRVGFRTLFYLPFFTSGVAMFILWKNLFNPQFGPINQAINTLLAALEHAASRTPPALCHLFAIGGAVVLAGPMAVWTLARATQTLRRGYGLAGCLGWLFLGGGAVSGLLVIFYGLYHFPELAGLHLEAPRWLSSTKNLLGLDPEHVWPRRGNFGLGARDALILMGIWSGIGGNNMLLYLAGLSNIPLELYEAAMIDGAGRWAKFRHVTWPQLAPTTFFIVIMSFIGGLQGGFEQARVMTEGKPAETTVTLGYYIYLEGFEEFRLGYASAVAWVLFLMIFVITCINWRFGSRQLNY